MLAQTLESAECRDGETCRRLKVLEPLEPLVVAVWLVWAARVEKVSFWVYGVREECKQGFEWTRTVARDGQRGSWFACLAHEAAENRIVGMKTRAC